MLLIWETYLTEYNCRVLTVYQALKHFAKISTICWDLKWKRKLKNFKSLTALNSKQTLQPFHLNWKCRRGWHPWQNKILNKVHRPHTHYPCPGRKIKERERERWRESVSICVRALICHVNVAEHPFVHDTWKSLIIWNYNGIVVTMAAIWERKKTHTHTIPPAMRMTTKKGRNWKYLIKSITAFL